MVARGHVKNGVIVLEEGVQLPEGQEVTVIAQAKAPASVDRSEALRGLIGIWKTEQPPNDDDVDQIIQQERMAKHG